MSSLKLDRIQSSGRGLNLWYVVLIFVFDKVRKYRKKCMSSSAVMTRISFLKVYYLN